MNKSDIIAVAAGAAVCIALYFFAGYAERVKNTLHKLLWLLPVCAFLISNPPEISLLPLYLGVITACMGFFTEQKSLRRKTSAAGAALMLLTVPVCLLNPRYRAKDYIGDFEKGFSTMKEHYVLTEHKGIDWDALYAKYQPLIEEADREQDAEKNFLAWSGFCAAFHDGHVFYSSEKEPDLNAARLVLGIDYGLSVMRMTDGRFAAVNVDASLNALGITNGTVITKWEGVSPDEASRNAPAYEHLLLWTDEHDDILILGSYPDIDNEIFYSGLLAAGTGGETASVTILDETGAEQTVTLQKIGDYADRVFQTADIVDKGLNIGTLTWKQLDETTACLRIKGMMYDSKSYASSDETDYKQMKTDLREAFAAFQADGVKDVVIDLRNNSGGSPIMVKAVASLFSPAGDYVCSADGKWDDENKLWVKDEAGNYVPDNTISYQGEDIMNGGRVILLVNANCVSAGDYMVKVMRGLPNVTVMGFTEPNGSCQAVGGLSLKHGSLQFSNCVTLNPEGGIFIDSGTDRQSGNALDIQIPFDEAAIHAIFDENEDYAMDQVLNLLRAQ